MSTISWRVTVIQNRPPVIGRIEKRFDARLAECAKISLNDHIKVAEKNGQRRIGRWMKIIRRVIDIGLASSGAPHFLGLFAKVPPLALVQVGPGFVWNACGDPVDLAPL